MIILKSLCCCCVLSFVWLSSVLASDIAIVTSEGGEDLDRWLARGETRDLRVVLPVAEDEVTISWHTVSDRLTLEADGAAVRVKGGDMVSRVPGDDWLSNLLGKKKAIDLEQVGETLTVTATDVQSRTWSASVNLIVYELTVFPDKAAVPKGEAREELEGMLSFLGRPCNAIELSFAPEPLYRQLTYAIDDPAIATVEPETLREAEQYLLFDSPLANGDTQLRFYLGGKERLVMPVEVHDQLWVLSYRVLDRKTPPEGETEQEAP